MKSRPRFLLLSTALVIPVCDTATGQQHHSAPSQAHSQPAPRQQSYQPPPQQHQSYAPPIHQQVPQFQQPQQPQRQQSTFPEQHFEQEQPFQQHQSAIVTNIPAAAVNQFRAPIQTGNPQNSQVPISQYPGQTFFSEYRTQPSDNNAAQAARERALAAARTHQSGSAATSITSTATTTPGPVHQNAGQTFSSENRTQPGDNTAAQAARERALAAARAHQSGSAATTTTSTATTTLSPVNQNAGQTFSNQSHTQPGDTNAAQAAREKALAAARAHQWGSAATTTTSEGRDAGRVSAGNQTSGTPSQTEQSNAERAKQAALAARTRNAQTASERTAVARLSNPALPSRQSPESTLWANQLESMKTRRNSNAQVPRSIVSNAAFKTTQQSAVSKLPPEKKTAVNAKILHNSSVVSSGTRPTTLKPQKGHVDLAKFHPGPKLIGPDIQDRRSHGSRTPGKNPQNVSDASSGKNGQHQQGQTTNPTVNPKASLGAANSWQSPTNNVALQGFIAASVIGAIGDAIVLGAGAFGQGALSYAGGGGGGYVDDGSGGDCSSPFNSGCVYIPNGDPSQPFDPNADGSGVVMAVNSEPSYSDGSADGADPQGNTFDQQIPLPSSTSTPSDAGVSPNDGSQMINDGTTVPIDSVPQSGRYLNIVNLSSSRTTIHVKYHAVDQSGQWNWFPSAPDADDDALSFDLDPGQTAELWDGDWHVYADKPRIWADSADGQNHWARYQTSDLLLVSEQDDQGQPSYLSPDIQTLSFGLK